MMKFYVIFFCIYMVVELSMSSVITTKLPTVLPKLLEDETDDDVLSQPHISETSPLNSSDEYDMYEAITSNRHHLHKRQLLSSLLSKARFGRRSSMPRTCQRDNPKYCSYISQEPIPSAKLRHLKYRSLAPWHQWRDENNILQQCCSCTYCVNANNRTQPIPTLYSQPIVSYGVTVGCACAPAE